MRSMQGDATLPRSPTHRLPHALLLPPVHSFLHTYAQTAAANANSGTGTATKGASPTTVIAIIVAVGVAVMAVFAIGAGIVIYIKFLASKTAPRDPSMIYVGLEDDML